MERIGQIEACYFVGQVPKTTDQLCLDAVSRQLLFAGLHTQDVRNSHQRNPDAGLHCAALRANAKRFAAGLGSAVKLHRISSRARTESTEYT